MGRGEAAVGRGGTPLRVRILRWARSLHGIVSLTLFLLVVISSLTGILLGWKKSADILQPPTRRAEATELREWRPLGELAAAASRALAEELDTRDPARITPDRMDVRPDDGIVKVLFPGTWEVQLEGVSAEVRSVARRHSDWIESLHDGSILGDGFKVVAMTALGLGLLVLSGSGLWMWYGPKRLRRSRRKAPGERRRVA